jgi:hypothetical protein
MLKWLKYMSFTLILIKFYSREFIGCHSTSVNLEARSIGGWGTSRHCVVTRLEDIASDQFREICAKAGALLIMLPRHITNLREEEKKVTSYTEREWITCTEHLNYFSSGTKIYKILMAVALAVYHLLIRCLRDKWEILEHFDHVPWPVRSAKEMCK